MIVGFPGHTALLLARMLTRKQIIFDSFISLYDTYVFDRKLVRENGLKSLYYYFLDWITPRLANQILFDTQSHVDYVVKTFRIQPQKIHALYLGSDPDIMYPVVVEPKKGFTVHFHGKFIPLQGTKYIVQAAKLLEQKGVYFNIIGSGQEYSYVRKLVQSINAQNITFIPPVPYEELKYWMAKADVCLGIFGDTEKAQRVIPNKVYEAAACRKAIISGESRAVKELFVNRKDILLCAVANPQSLADAILELKNNNRLRTSLADNAYKLFQNKLTPKKIATELFEVIERQELLVH